MLTKLKIFSILLTLMVISIYCKSQTTYYIDQVAGNDANNGTTISTPWKNLSKINTLTLTAGSKVLLKAGSVWTGQQLKFSGSGTSSSPIVVDAYGTGADPLINGNGLTGQGVVYLYNQQYIEINNLEITNSPNGAVDSIFFVGVNDGVTNNNPLGADRRGVMIAIDNYGTANHIYLKNLNIHHVKGQLGSGSNTVNGAIPKRTGGIFFTVLGNTETSTKNSRFNDILIDSCNINYCENNGLALDNEWNVYYPGSTEYTNWYNRRFSNVKISNNIIHHIGKNAMIVRCTDSTGLVERNICYETALGTTGNTMFTARAKGTVFQYNEGYFNRATTQTVDPGNIDGSMYDPDYGSVGIIFQYSYSHDNSEGIYWGCNTRSLSNNTSGIPDPGDTACTLRYCVSQNDKGDLVFLNYSSAGNEIYNNVFYTKSGLSPNIIHENGGNNHTYNFYNNIIYNLSSSSTGADYAFGSGTGVQTRSILNNVFYGNHPSTEPSDANKLTSNPNFVSAGTATTGIASTNGYRLNYGSPAINSGRIIPDNGGLDYYGNIVSATTAPNRGCYQGAGIGAPNSLPVINSFTPSTATAGSTITIRGLNFTGTLAVKFGGTSASSFTVVNDTTISAVLGNGSTGYIIVTTANGSDTSATIFNFCVPPTAPTATGVSICKGATATLSATGAGSLSWFNASSGGTRLFNGSSYTTPALSVSTTYYVQDSTCAVSSTRTAVVVSIYASTNATTTASACSSYTWSRNNTSYSASGTYTYGYTNTSGCAAVDTLKLTIKQPTSSTTTASNCVSYSWNGVTYTVSGTYTKLLTNAANCDSTAILNLTIKQPTASTTTVSNCVSYLWNGVTYTASGTYTKLLTNAVNCDSTAILNLTIKQPTSSTTTVSNCVSYLWNGVTYTTSGTYTKLLTNAANCDSSAILKLTIKQPTTSTTAVSNCVSYSWNGVTYTVSGSYTKLLTNAVGCDSTAILNLTIKQPTSSTTTASNCVNYLWNGITYTASGTYTKLLANAVGCDSTAILNLTIKQPSSSTNAISNCVSYLWNGVTYTASGTYTKTGFINVAGCDSTAYLSLTIKQPTFTSQSTSACETYTWAKNGTTYTNSGTYIYNYTNSAGCSSADSLKLTINFPTHNVTSVTACDSYTWSRNGQTYFNSGTYVFTYNNVFGCSSADTLKLIVNNSNHFVTTASSCDTYTWSKNNIAYTSTGVYTYTYNNSLGCLSVDTLKLNIKNSKASSFTASACNSYVLPWGTTVTASGQYTYNYTSINGCDSVVTANITVNQGKISTTSVVICSSSLPYLWNGASYTASGSYSYFTTTVQVCDSVAVLNLSVNSVSSSTTNVAVCNSSLPYYWNGTAYTTSGTYSKLFTNAVGCDSTAILILSVNTATPTAPTTLTQTLVSNVCGARIYRYTVAAVTNAYGYAWTLPVSIGGVTGVFVDSGDITKSRVIRVRYNSNAAALTIDSIFVRAFSGCGTSVNKSFKLTNTVLTVPAAPASITITAITTNVCGNRIYRYTAPALPAATTTATAATGYLWSFVGTLGLNAVVDSGSLNSRIVRMKFTSNAAAVTGDSVRVLYTSACGNSLNKTAKLTNTVLNVPAAPASITVTAITTNVCGSRVYRYAAPNLPVATTTAGAASGYLWSFSGALGANAVIDSGTTNSQKIVVRFSSNLASAAGDSVKVLYTSDCGNSLNKALKLTNTALITPIPASITIALVSDVCGARVYRYTAPATTLATTTAPATTGWQWTMPFGAVGSTGTLDSGSLTSKVIKIKYTSNAAAGTGDSIKLAYVSDCGVGANKVVKLSNVAKTGCPITPVIIPSNKNVNEIYVGGDFNFSVYPNPFTNSCNIEFLSSNLKAQKNQINIIDLQGRILKSWIQQSDKKINIGSELKPGHYILQIRQGDEFKSTPIIKY